LRPRTDSDVAIIGTGPAGASAAIALANAGYDVALFERQRPAKPQPGEVLAAAARAPLEALGLWPAFLALDPIAGNGQVSIWGRAKAYEAPGLFNAYGAGWHIDRRRFDGLLRQAAIDAGARLFPISRLTGTVAGAKGDWALQFDGRQEHRACFVVDASGRSRAFARKVGAAYENDDDLVGLPSRFTGRRGRAAEPPQLLMEAADIGWWYSAPLPGNDLVVGLMTDPGTMMSLDLRDAGIWRRHLDRTVAMAGLLSAYGDGIGPNVLLANSGRVTPAGGANWLAAGDAAASYDPLAGQGVMSALWGGVKAGEAVSNWFHGRRAPLEAYIRAQDTAYRRYLENKRAYYRQERRWPDSPFWRAQQDCSQGHAA